MNKLPNELGRRLRELREERQMSMKGVARMVGVDASFLSRIERGLAPAPAQLVRDLARTLATPEDPLLVLADHLPDDVKIILHKHPERALTLLRESFGKTRRPQSARRGFTEEAP